MTTETPLDRFKAVLGGTSRALVAEYYQRVFGKDLPESVVGKAK